MQKRITDDMHKVNTLLANCNTESLSLGQCLIFSAFESQPQCQCIFLMRYWPIDKVSQNRARLPAATTPLFLNGISFEIIRFWQRKNAIFCTMYISCILLSRLLSQIFLNINSFICSLPDLLKQTNTQPLNVRMIKLMTCEDYKIVNDLSPKYINDLVNIKNSSYNFRSEKKAEVPQVNSTRYGLRSFRSEAPRIWNSLPNELRVAESYPQLRRLIQRWDGFGCQYHLCYT